MNSMTGFGRAELNSKLGKLTVELSSVNSRFLELSVRLPRSLSVLEPQVREQLTAAVSRGKVSLFVGLDEPEDPGGSVLINKAMARAYYRQLRQLQQDLGLGGNITIHDLLLLPEVTRPEKTQLDKELAGRLLAKVVDKGLKSLLAMRAREGKALVADMHKRLRSMTSLTRRIEKRTVGAVVAYSERLSARLQELLSAPQRDSLRLEEEIALFADRTDVAEECTRLTSHIDQFNATLKQSNAVGRRLNFILQEMNREVNTIGSKCAEFQVSSIVITLKEEIEKLREQVQNLE